MKRFEVELGVLITIQDGGGFVVEAENEEEAIKKAKDLLEEYISDKYVWSDYDSIEVDYVGEIDE